MKSLIFRGKSLQMGENPLRSDDMVSGQPQEWFQILERFIAMMEEEEKQRKDAEAAERDRLKALEAENIIEPSEMDGYERSGTMHAKAVGNFKEDDHPDEVIRKREEQKLWAAREAYLRN